MLIRLVSRSTISFPWPSLVGSLKSGKSAQSQARIGPHQRGEDLLVDLVADVAFAAEFEHIPEARTRGDGNSRGKISTVFVLVGDVLDEQQ